MSFNILSKQVIYTIGPTGGNGYLILIRDQDLAVYAGNTASDKFIQQEDAVIADCALAFTEHPVTASLYYQLPINLKDGKYVYVIYGQIGGSPNPAVDFFYQTSFFYIKAGLKVEFDGTDWDLA